MNAFKNTIKLALIGTALAGLSVLTSCNCGSTPEPVDPPPYVAPVTK
ncbi:MAG: hypothetical protein PVJ98_05620 [Akkermansiaceae bacterium]|jgi:hypothetical protein